MNIQAPVQFRGVETQGLLDATGRLVAARMDGAARDPSGSAQLADPILTALVLGTPQRKVNTAESIFSRIVVPNVRFEYISFNAEHMLVQDTARGDSAPYRYSDFSYETIQAKTSRHSWAALADVRTLENQNPSVVLDLGSKKAELARRAVWMDRAQEIATLLGTNTNYHASNRLAIAGGDEWDTANGDPRGDIDVMEARLVATIGADREDIVLSLGLPAYNALRKNADFLAERGYKAGDQHPTSMDMADWLGVKAVNKLSLHKVSTATGAPTQMWADIAIGHVDQTSGDMDTTYGKGTFATWFAPEGGVFGSAGEPWLERSISSWIYPWDEEWLLAIVDNTAGFIITNCAA